MTEVVDRTLSTARGLAAEHRHGFVGTEHLLAALLSDDTSLAATLFASAGIEPARARQELLTGLRQGPEGAPSEPTLSRFAERVVEAARTEALREGREAVEDRDLLRQLLAQPKGRMSQLLKADPRAPVALRAALGLPDPPVAPPQATAPAAAEAFSGSEEAVAKPAVEARQGREAREPRPPREPRDKKPREEANPQPRGEAKRERPERPKREEGRRDDPKSASPRAEQRADRPGRDRSDSNRQPARPAVQPPGPRRIARPQPTFRFRLSWLLFLALPAAAGLWYTGADPLAVLPAAAVGLAAFAVLAGYVSEALADRAGPTIGAAVHGLLGNTATLVVVVVALMAGATQLAQGALVGAIVATALLVPGLGSLAAGMEPSVRTNRSLQRASGAAVVLALVGLGAATAFVRLGQDTAAVADPSYGMATVLLLTYLAAIWHARRTKTAVFGRGEHTPVAPPWGPGTAIGLLVLALGGLAASAGLLVGALPAATARGIPFELLAFVLVPLVAALPERAPALEGARRGRVDLAFQGACAGAAQGALVLAPLAVAIGAGLGSGMSLVLGRLELAGLVVTAAALTAVSSEDETGWFRGAQLVALYGLIAVAALFI
ncbi:MAG: hypothetical protein KF785_03255 [Gemmatimonadales bacterium]|nr:hypothetical protein [Gemmatimonadales bacterium]